MIREQEVTIIKHINQEQFDIETNRGQKKPKTSTPGFSLLSYIT